MTRIITFGAPMRPDPDRLAALNLKAIQSGWLTNGGPLAARLERAVSQHLGARAMLTSSGTMALMMALHLGDLPHGAEVILPALSFPASAQAVAWCGFRPVFADVDPATLTLCPQAARKAISPRTAAIMPVHLYGVPVDPAIDDLARETGLWSAHDAAQAYGITENGIPVATRGDACAFSLHATKLLHTGEGGALVTAKHPQAQRMRNFGMRALRPSEPGTNAKLSEFQAAVGLALLPDLEDEIRARHALRHAYEAALLTCPGVTAHPTRPEASPSPVYYTLRAAPQLIADILSGLARNGILARGPQPPLCGPGTRWHTQTVPPNAARRWGETLCLPLHSGVTGQDVSRIATIIHRCAKGYAP